MIHDHGEDGRDLPVKEPRKRGFRDAAGIGVSRAVVDLKFEYSLAVGFPRVTQETRPWRTRGRRSDLRSQLVVHSFDHPKHGWKRTADRRLQVVSASATRIIILNPHPLGGTPTTFPRYPDVPVLSSWGVNGSLRRVTAPTQDPRDPSGEDGGCRETA